MMTMDISGNNKVKGKTVLVTGFGPFRDHKINASWEAVKLLPSLTINDDVKLVVKEIPVTYEAVDSIVPQLWKDLQPDLVVHVGVSSYTNKIKIETKGHGFGYKQTDCASQCFKKKPVNECLNTKLDIEKICSQVNTFKNNSICPSEDAGRYLCEYIYYTSLKIDPNKTLFIHVPCINKPYTVEELARLLQEIINSALNCSSSC